MRRLPLILLTALAAPAVASAPQEGTADAIVAPDGSPSLLPRATGAGGGIITPTPPLPDGMTWHGWATDQPAKASPPETIPAVPLPPGIVLLPAAIAALAAYRGITK